MITVVLTLLVLSALMALLTSYARHDAFDVPSCLRPHDELGRPPTRL